jgi:hypothetical protein
MVMTSSKEPPAQRSSDPHPEGGRLQIGMAEIKSESVADFISESVAGLLRNQHANKEGAKRKITAIEGIPAMGLDGLGSSAHGPEAALTILS